MLQDGGEKVAEGIHVRWVMASRRLLPAIMALVVASCIQEGAPDSPVEDTGRCDSFDPDLPSDNPILDASEVAPGLDDTDPGSVDGHSSDAATQDNLQPDSAEHTCHPETPFPSGSGSGCYQCYEDQHCAESGKVCDLPTHTCVPDTFPSCSAGQVRCPDRHCHECCWDQDCPSGYGPCVNGYCGNELDPCNDMCNSQYPRCVFIDSVPLCVQCTQDSDCTALDADCYCSGNPTYTCLIIGGGLCGYGGSCNSVCATDSHCPVTQEDEETWCMLRGGGVGYCYAPSGFCNHLDVCCAAGQSCFDPLKVLAILLGHREWTDSYLGACSCDEFNPCLGGQACQPIDEICNLPIVGHVFCPGGMKSQRLPEGICMEWSEFLELVTP